MSRIKNTFESLKAKGETVFIPYITAGDPDMKTTDAIVECLISNGADIIELGIPFSDPMADGPTIQAASQRALNNDFSIDPSASGILLSSYSISDFNNHIDGQLGLYSTDFSA